MKHLQSFDDFILNESNMRELIGPVKKGQKVQVMLTYLKNSPLAIVEACDDSSFNDNLECETFTFLYGGDMKMFAKLKEGKWVS